MVTPIGASEESLSALADKQMSVLTVLDAYRLAEMLRERVSKRTDELPLMTWVDDYGMLMCPHCLRMTDKVYDEDVAVRWTQLDVECYPHPKPVLTGAYDGHGDYEGRMFRCGRCALPVSVPAWLEVESV